MKMISEHAFSETEAREKFKSVIEINDNYSRIGYFAVYLLNVGTFIGIGKIVMSTAHEAEIGYAILSEYWGKGFGSEISARLVKQACSIHEINKLIAIIDPENIPSKKILEKSNFKHHMFSEMDGLPAEILWKVLNNSGIK
jgi:hypothetical protein